MTVSEAALAELGARVARLEQIVSQLQTVRLPRAAARPQTERERLLAELRTTGLIAEPGPHVRARAEAWRRLSEEEKRRFRQDMDALQLDPPLSQIITESRR